MSDLEQVFEPRNEMPPPSFGVDIRIKDGQRRFYVGQTVEGTAQLTLPSKFPLSNVSLSYRTVGEVKWIEYIGSPHYLNSHVFFDKYEYHEEALLFCEKDVKVESEDVNEKKVSIPFKFVIPKDKNLPSTMVSNHGFVKHFVRVGIKQEGKDEVKKFNKDLVVLAPMDKNLMITVGGTAEKNVLLHGGAVTLHASIGRKGFAPGESINVHLSVDNKTNAKVVPRVSLFQVQIFMCGIRHKTIETVLNEPPTIGSEIGPHSKTNEVLSVALPPDESLSIKSNLITVKYFVHVTLDIPHSFDLHINLPLVVTSKKFIDELAGKDDADQADIV